MNQAVLIAIAVDREGRRQFFAVELANRESQSSWRDFLLGLRKRGLSGVEFMVSDDQAGPKAAIREALPETVWQRCYASWLPGRLTFNCSLLHATVILAALGKEADLAILASGTRSTGSSPRLAARTMARQYGAEYGLNRIRSERGIPFRYHRDRRAGAGPRESSIV